MQVFDRLATRTECNELKSIEDMRILLDKILRVRTYTYFKTILINELNCLISTL